MNASAIRSTISAKLLADFLAGVAGGVLAGLIDAVVTAVGLGSHPRLGLLLLLAGGVGGCSGGLMLALFVALRAGLARLPGTRRWPGPSAATLMSAPVLVVDSIALFAGEQAGRVPAWPLISGVLVAAGLLGMFLIGRVCSRELTDDSAAGRRRRIAWIALWVVATVVAMTANRLVLPRLYPWFHATLSLMSLVTIVLAVRATLALAGPDPRRRPAARSFVRPPGALMLALVGSTSLSLVAGIVGLRALRGGHTLLQLAHQVPLTALVLPALAPMYTSTPGRTTPAGAAPSPEPSGPRTPGPRLPDADVVLITIDALRADHVGAYGYHRPVTPNIDALARRGVRFERAYAQAPHTSFSVASMLTGKYFPTLARLAPGDNHDPVTVPLRQAGWTTAGFYPPAIFFEDGDKLKAYRDNHFHFQHVQFGYADAPVRLAEVQNFFNAQRPQRAFVWVHFFEPHEPYDRQSTARFGDSDLDRYDGEIAHADKAVGQLLDFLERRRPGAIIILAADHGEEFDEHGGRYHGSTLFDEQVRIPLIIAVPGVEPRVLPGPVELCESPPTILGLLDVPVPPRMRGTDLGPWLANPPDQAPLPPAFSEMRDKRMVVHGADKLICDLNWGYCELYDLRADPGEKHNLAERQPDRVAALRAILDGWLDDHLRFEPQLARGRSNPDGGQVPRSIERGRLGDLAVLDDLHRSAGQRRIAGRPA